MLTSLLLFDGRHDANDVFEIKSDLALSSFTAQDEFLLTGSRMLVGIFQTDLELLKVDLTVYAGGI